MIRITMLSRADTVKGQGVGSAYDELVKMLKERFSSEFHIEINTTSKADVSHYHTINPEFYLSTFSKKSRGVRVGYVHFLPETLKGSIDLFPPFQKVFNWYVMSFYRRMDLLVVVNPSFIPELVAAGIPEDKICYIPNFVSREDFYPQAPTEKVATRQRLGFSQDDFIVLGVGQVQKRKGVDDFIQLAKENPDLQFVWAGGFSFGKLTDGYDEYREVYENPPANLTFTGILDRSELVDYYNMVDVFLLPSYNELFPMSILEAFSCHTPVMVRNLELYESVISGYYLGTEDRVEMGAKLRELAADPSQLAHYADLSAKAAEHYSEDNVAKIWYRFYTDLAQGKQLELAPDSREVQP